VSELRGRPISGRTGDSVVGAATADPGTTGSDPHPHPHHAQRSREVQRLEKLLEEAEITLSLVATEIAGASGRAMLQALVTGPIRR
jgi:hypothetical protein